MTTLQLYNTMTSTLEEVRPLDGKKIRLYTCGPTVYDYAHIGNFRTFFFEDILRRALRFFGMKVEQVMNITDVDDKTIKGAIAKNMTLDAYTKSYKDAFFDDLLELHIERVEHYPCATDYIPQMIAMIEALIEKKIAYIGKDTSVYFDIAKYDGYGKLSHLKLDELQSGTSQVTQDEYTKENPHDFVLWKAYDEMRDGTVFWESPFGRGRPGWHLECSVMANTLLGETIDIHAGGVDLIFPHHENEIAQSECCTGKCFSRMWVHAEHLLVDGKKMSKSLGNFYTLRDLIKKGYTGKQIRFLFMQSHYRMQLNFTLSSLDAAKHAIERINDFIVRLESYEAVERPQRALFTFAGRISASREEADVAVFDEAIAPAIAEEKNATGDSLVGGRKLTEKVNKAPQRPDISHFIQEVRATFSAALAHDLNMPGALGVLFEMIRHVNVFCDEKKLTAQDAKAILDFVKEMDSVFGVCAVDSLDIPFEVQRLVDLRQEARKNREYKQADGYRQELVALGYVLEDTPQGVRVKKK